MLDWEKRRLVLAAQNETLPEKKPAAPGLLQTDHDFVNLQISAIEAPHEGMSQSERRLAFSFAYDTLNLSDEGLLLRAQQLDKIVFIGDDGYETSALIQKHNKLQQDLKMEGYHQSQIQEVSVNALRLGVAKAGVRTAILELKLQETVSLIKVPQLAEQIVIRFLSHRSS